LAEKIQRVIAGESEQDSAARETVAAGVALGEAERQELAAQRALDRLAIQHIESDAKKHDAVRVAREIGKADVTLVRFARRVVERNIDRICSHINDALRALMRKQDLISDLTIDPDTLDMVLTGSSGSMVEPTRLSAGERQLLATAVLWGLSQATNLVLPTVIDTPVGRLDKSHRENLVERYFPAASRQVLLLSTDEEIVGRYYTKLQPYVGAEYVLEYDERSACTSIVSGYLQ
jgi:DNA sulfur modification protein DndD